MKLSDGIAYYYLNIKQKWFMIIHFCKLYLQISDFKVVENNCIKSVLARYFLYNCLNRIINFFKFLRNNIDLNTDINKTEITKITETGEKTIILESDNNSFKKINDKLAIIIPDNNMINSVFINFELVNSENEKICLKSLIMKYNDPETKYPHSLSNILLFNNIKYNNDSYLNIKLFKNKRIISHKLLLNDIISNHINYFSTL